MSIARMRPHPALAGEVSRSDGGGISLVQSLTLHITDNNSPCVPFGDTSPASGVRTRVGEIS